MLCGAQLHRRDPEGLEQRGLAPGVRHRVSTRHQRGLGDRRHDRAAQLLALHDRRRPADRPDSAEVVDLELPLEIVPADLGDWSETRRQAGGVEQAVQPAELEHRPSEQRVETGVVPHVGRHRYGAPGKFCARPPSATRSHCSPSRSATTTWAPSSAKRSAADFPMPLPPPMITTMCRARSLVRAVPRDLLLDLAALQRPVLELEHVRFGNELEAIDRLRILDALEHRPIADVRGDRAALVGEGRNHAEAGEEDDLGPVVERGLAAFGVSPVVGLVLGAGGGELRRGWRRDPSLRSGGQGGAQDDGQTPGAEQVLGGGHAAADQLRDLLAIQRQHQLIRIVEVENDPLVPAECAANDREHELGELMPLGRRRHRAQRGQVRGAVGSLDGDELVHPAGDLDQAVVAFGGVLTPDDQPVMGQGEARSPVRRSPPLRLSDSPSMSWATARASGNPGRT